MVIRFEKMATVSIISEQPLYTSFHDLINVYSCRPGADNPRGQNFDVNRNILSLRSFATSLKNIFVNNFFYDFIHVYGPGATADNTLGTKFWCQEEHLVASVICCKLKKNLFEVWFYTFFFHDSIHVYSPGAGADSPQGKKFWCQQKCLVTSLILASLKKKMSLKSDFIQLFSWFNTCI